ncbi:hypothetical protein GCM10022251_41420 [Phytohabitans flavus]|uniref:Uncharacterized protein n=1 Tax=Phytohabitans flavus TaxID=1076124 RepID=A0A6F8Y0L0_9ACTN|nr:hypothetical protein [Phytohabitans flavus]BCB79615.1 hypothetical protein Pflav_060250 [Phytohabitans flavus]
MAEPESLNAPVASYVPDANDMEKQAAHDKMMAHIRIVVDQAPPLSDEQISLLRELLSGPKPHPSRFRRWQVKLSCGHGLPTESLDDNPPQRALDCTECGAAGRIVVAFQPLDRSGEPQPDPTTAPRLPRRRTRAELEAQIADLQAQLAQQRDTEHP